MTALRKVIALWSFIALAGCTIAAPKSLKGNEDPGGHRGKELPFTKIIVPEKVGGEHPCLFVTSDTLRAARARFVSDPAAAKAFAEFKNKALELTAAKLEVPDIPGEWAHNYVCKQCGVRLKHEGGKHQCPRCYKEYSGWPYDGVVAGTVHGSNWNAMRHLALAYALTDEVRFAEKSREILLAYSDRYTKFPIHDYKGTKIKKGARLTAQTLDEAIRALDAAWAYDLIYHTLSDSDRAQIKSGLLLPLAKTISRNDMGIVNWQSWHNAAYFAIGRVTGNREWVDLAINGRSGLLFQLENSVLDDGFWYEGAASYHMYALDAIQQTILASEVMGLNLLKHPRFRPMYDAPLAILLPDGTFPPINDSDPDPITRFSDHFALAHHWFGDTRYAAVAAQNPTMGVWEMLLGSVSVRNGATKLQLGNSYLANVGAVRLWRDGSEGPVAALMDFGPHGGAHGHFDKLGIVLYGLGQTLLPDPGRLDYGVPLHHQWYKTTIAHNTIGRNGELQKPDNGTLIGCGEESNFTWAQAETTGTYPGTTLRRTIILTDTALLDLVEVESDTTATWDMVHHVETKDVRGSEWQPVPLKEIGTANGYEQLEEPMKLVRNSGGWHEDHPVSKGWLLVRGATHAQSEYFSALGASGREVKRIPLYIERQSGSRAIFVTGHYLRDKTNSSLEAAVKVVDSCSTDALCVTGNDGPATFTYVVRRGAVANGAR